MDFDLVYKRNTLQHFLNSCKSLSELDMIIRNECTCADDNGLRPQDECTTTVATETAPSRIPVDFNGRNRNYDENAFE